MSKELWEWGVFYAVEPRVGELNGTWFIGHGHGVKVQWRVGDNSVRDRARRQFCQEQSKFGTGRAKPIKTNMQKF